MLSALILSADIITPFVLPKILGDELWPMNIVMMEINEGSLSALGLSKTCARHMPSNTPISLSDEHFGLICTPNAPGISASPAQPQILY
jgi:hypothetical protein